MPKRWRALLWIFTGILIGEVTVQIIDPNLNWQKGLLAIVIGGLSGLIFQKYVLNSIVELFKKFSVQSLLIQGFGMLYGLLISVLFTVIIRPFLELLPFRNSLFIFFLLFFLITGSLMLIVSVKLKEFSLIFFDLTGHQSKKTGPGKNQLKILDTSAIIDGRIADLCKTGFLEGVLIIPNFVLNELQKIADSADSLRRNRGRRGLDLLNKIQKENHVTIRIFDRDYEELSEVDTKLLRLARELEAKVITNDFNLNKVAELYGVQVLNINELSNAIKPVVLPGEEMMVRVLRDGREHGQGIGYLEDGTMIVVEGGKSFIGVDLEILVTSVLQTSAGRMIFAKPKECLINKVTS